MATLYVTEYATLGVPQVGGMVSQTPQEPPLVEQTVSIGASSTQSNAFNAADNAGAASYRRDLLSRIRH